MFPDHDNLGSVEQIPPELGHICPFRMIKGVRSLSNAQVDECHDKSNPCLSSYWILEALSAAKFDRSGATGKDVVKIPQHMSVSFGIRTFLHKVSQLLQVIYLLYSSPGRPGRLSI